MREFLLPVMLMSASIGYVLYSFKRERRILREHRIMMTEYRLMVDYMMRTLPIFIHKLQEGSHEKVDWKKEGF